MRKQAAPPVNPSALEPLTRELLNKMMFWGAVGAVPGGLFGKYVTPRIFHYKGDPAAENLATLIDAGVAGGLAAMLRRPGLIQKYMERPFVIPGLVSALAGAELLPQGLASVRQMAARKTTYDKLVDALKTRAAQGTMKGVGAGAAAGALAGLGTGLTRAPSEAERAEGGTRSSMAVRDMLKFMIPAMLAGGVGGHVIGKRQQQAAPPPPTSVAAL